MLQKPKSSFRPYRPALGIETAIEEINTYKGVYYDKDVVDACSSVFSGGDFSFDEAVKSTTCFHTD